MMTLVVVLCFSSVFCCCAVCLSVFGSAFFGSFRIHSLSYSLSRSLAAGSRALADPQVNMRVIRTSISFAKPIVLMYYWPVEIF